jgi:hypothetical protein
MEESVLRQAFAKTEEPLGWYLSGMLSDRREAFDLYKKSAEEGCGWGQVEYGDYFEYGEFVEKDVKVYVEWLEKAANQNNPQAMDRLGFWFWGEEQGNDKEKAVSYYRAGVELGWESSMSWLAEMLRLGEGCTKDVRQAVMWGAKGDDLGEFFRLLEDGREAFERGTTNKLDCDFDHLCYSIGWGLYWHMYGTEDWNESNRNTKAFGDSCLDYYCSCVEMQQKSIFTFLLCWNRMTGGVKGPGQMIGKMVWVDKADNCLQTFWGFSQSQNSQK